ncbi:replication factor C subunit 1 [Ancistrocladus abbreviatus]
MTREMGLSQQTPLQYRKSLWQLLPSQKSRSVAVDCCLLQQLRVGLNVNFLVWVLHRFMISNMNISLLTWDCWNEYLVLQQCASRRKTSKYFDEDQEKTKSAKDAQEASAKRKTHEDNLHLPNVKSGPPKEVRKIEDDIDDDDGDFDTTSSKKKSADATPGKKLKAVWERELCKKPRMLTRVIKKRMMIETLKPLLNLVEGIVDYLLCDEDIGGWKSAKAKELGLKLLLEDKVGNSAVECIASKAFTLGTSAAKKKVQTTECVSLTWTEKYKPKVPNDIIGDQSLVKQLHDWLPRWDEQFLHNKGEGKKQNDSGAKKAVLLSGTPGIGKTTSMKLGSQMLGYQTIEVNASDNRGKADAKIVKGIGGSTENSVKEIISNESLSTNMDRLIAKRLLQIANAEGLQVNEFAERSNGDMRLALNQLRYMSLSMSVIKYDDIRKCLLSSAKDEDISPFTETSESFELAVCSLFYYGYYLKCFEDHLSMLSGFNGNKLRMDERIDLSISDPDLVPLIIQSSQGIKAVVSCFTWGLEEVVWKLEPKCNEVLPWWFKALGTPGEPLNQIGLELWAYHQLIGNKGEYIIARVCLIEAFVMIHAYQIVNLENYINYIPISAGKDDNGMKRMNLIARATESIADGDIFNVQFRRYRQWQLCQSASVSSSIIPYVSRIPGFSAALMHGHREALEQGEHNFNRFGGWLGKNLTMGKILRLLEDLHVHVLASSGSNLGRDTLQLDFLSLLLRQLTEPLKLMPKDTAVRKVVDFMGLYSITLEDFDTVVELSKYKGHGSAPYGLQPAVKAAITSAHRESTRSRVVCTADLISVPGMKKAPKKQVAAVSELGSDELAEEVDDVEAESEEENSSDVEDLVGTVDNVKKLQMDLESNHGKGVQCKWT